jgi:hypothetical protein
MPGPVVTMSSTVMCAHAGTATATVPAARVILSGTPAVTIASPYVVAGCALTGTPTPPCVTGQWLVGAVRVTTTGQPLALQSGSSLTTPTGSPMLPVAVQPRVIAS